MMLRDSYHDSQRLPTAYTTQFVIQGEHDEDEEAPEGDDMQDGYEMAILSTGSRYRPIE
jgi:hypothetical protein